jgi:hypothetical protein
MTGDDFRKAVERVGLSVYAAADFLGLSRRTCYRIAAGEYEAPAAAARLLRLMAKLKVRPEDVP